MKEFIRSLCLLFFIINALFAGIAFAQGNISSGIISACISLINGLALNNERQ